MKSLWFHLSAVLAAILVASVVIRFFNTVSERSVVDVTIFSLYVIGGIVLIFAPFGRKRRRSPWALGVLALSGALLIFVGAAELLRHYSVWGLSPPREHGFSFTLALLQGVVLGLFVALGFSGELADQRLSQSDKT